jgi:hypothetical protein
VFNLSTTAAFFAATNADAAFDLGAVRVADGWDIGPGCGLVLT